MNGLRALCYLDMCRLRNTIRSIASKPGRLWGWIALMVFVVGPQIMRRRLSPGTMPTFSIHEPYSSMIGGAICLFMGWSVAGTARSGRLFGSSDPVDPYMLVRSKVPESVAFVWLRVRFILLTLARSIFMLVVGVLLLRGKDILWAYAAFLGVVLLWNLIGIPAFFVARWNTLAVVIVGSAIAACGVALVSAECFWMVHPSPGLAAFLLQLNVGRVVHQLSVGRLLPLACLYGCSLACMAVGALCSGDIYPELYGSSRRVADVVKRVRERGLWTMPVSFRSSRSGASSPLRGPYAEIWKQLAFTRRANGKAIVASALAGAVLLGAVIAILIRSAAEDFGYSLLGVGSLMCAMWLALQGVSLATDLSKPLWWLGDGTLFEKFFAWTIGNALSVSVLYALVMVTVGVLVRSGEIAAIGLLAALCVPFAFRAIGVYVYSVTPSMIDQRGPGAALRVLIVYGALIPAVAIAIVSMFIFPHFVLVLFVILDVLALEGVLALYLAARRIEGRGVEFARAEQQ